MKILLIEDNQGDVQILDIILSEILPEHKLTILNSGHKAVDYIKSYMEDESPDIIIVDMKLPRYSGLNILKQIKTHPILAKSPVYIFTSTPDAQTESAALKYGADGFFIKPILLDAYITAVKKMFRIYNPPEIQSL